MNISAYILPFYQKLEVSLYYLKHTEYKSGINKLADLIDIVKNKYKISSKYNEWLVNAQNREPSDYFTAAEVWYRNACLELEARTKQKLKDIFPLYDVFFL